jgi:ATP-dependent helicase YprA (DUF1998 family)
MTICPLHGYTETSARHKLQRHRDRGDTDYAVRFHPECGQWHVEQLVVDEVRRALLAEHRRCCADFYCNCRDDEDDDA